MSHSAPVKNLMKKWNIRPSKGLGQCFLINKQVVQVIIEAARIVGQHVVEIGPGLGVLTKELLLKAQTVTAYEIDSRMHTVLSHELQSDKLELIRQDFLLANIDWTEPKALVANLPYNITTKIIFKIIKHINKFTSATIMVQKEYGERMLAQPKTKQYGKLSVSLQSIADLQQIIIVKNTSFFPAPKVDSMVVHINFHTSYNPEYLNFILKCFAHQRKTLINNLKQFVANNHLQEILQQMGLKINVRPQELSVVEFQKLWSLLKQNNFN